MTRVLLHIGMNKTGSSALQAFFGTARAELARAGVLWPETGRGGRKQHLQLANALGFALDPAAGPAPAAERAALRAALLEEAGAAAQVVLSSEVFSRRRDLAPVTAFFAGMDLRVVVYLRRHDHWWASRYAQAVEMVADPPWAPGFTAFWEHSRKGRNLHLSFRELTDSWAAAIGPERLIVRPYEPARMPGGIVADFLAATGLPAPASGVPADRVNPSVSEAGLAEIDRLQRTRMPALLRRNRVASVAARDAEQGGGARGTALIPPALRRRLVAENLDDYAHVARTYLGRPDGVLFEEPLPEPGGADGASGSGA